MANNTDEMNAACTVQTSKVAANCTQKICEQGFIDCDKLKSVEAVNPIYEESSCLVWRLCLKEGHPDRSHCYILKIAQTKQETPFWQMMDSLFKVSISDNMLDGGFIYDFVRRMVPVAVPEYVRSSNMDDITCLLMTYIDGSTQERDANTDENVKILAEFLAETHRNAVIGFGSLKSVLHDDKGFEPNLWTQKLFNCLNQLANQAKMHAADSEAGISKNKKSKLVKQANNVAAYVANLEETTASIKVKRFVPVMIDLRWDQFAYKKGKLSGLYDLDAYVSAPYELDFVLLEYLLKPEQLALFKTTYKESKGHIPKIGKVRDIYRVFFFLINAMGESDFDKWMAQPRLFD